MEQYFDEKTIWESPTGALISGHDFRFLSSAQQAQCKKFVLPKIDLEKAFASIKKPDESPNQGEQQDGLWNELFAALAIANKLIIGGYDKEADIQFANIKSRYRITRISGR